MQTAGNPHRTHSAGVVRTLLSVSSSNGCAPCLMLMQATLIVVVSRTPLVSRGVRECRDSARPGWWGQPLQSAADSGISRATMPSALTSSTPTCRRMASTPSCLR